ncbi:Protein-export protein SecB [Trichinella spiralis]|uniref:Protein-export protein SecB n=1 Tax=Trichinella spiralis TaxID=6334 RepID=A0ABR3K3Z3_TRISP
MVQWFHFAILIVACFSTNEAAASVSPDSIHCLLFPKLTECYEKSVQSLKSWKSKIKNSKFNGMKNILVRKSRSSGFQQYITSDNVKLRKLADYCAKYNIQNQQLCQDATTEVLTDPDVRKFCSAYRVICEQNSIGPSSWALQQPTWKTKSYQNVAFNPNVKDFCNTFRLVAIRNCNGNEQGKFIELCSLYRQRCPYLAPSVEWPPWPRTANNSVLVQQLCEKYRFVYKANCPGYEVQQLRPYCNTYRVYCLGECPKMIIDGSVSVARNIWGVGGIPFYPFNPEGLSLVTQYRSSMAGVNVATGVGVGLGGVGLLGNLFSSSGKSITQFSSDLLRAGLIQHMPVV